MNQKFSFPTQASVIRLFVIVCLFSQLVLITPVDAEGLRGPGAQTAVSGRDRWLFSFPNGQHLEHAGGQPARSRPFRSMGQHHRP